jgi:hypothetical protein
MAGVHLPCLDHVEAGAPASEIEITPEMIEAGIAAAFSVDGLTHGVGYFSPHDLVREVYLAMRRRYFGGMSPNIAEDTKASS